MCIKDDYAHARRFYTISINSEDAINTSTTKNVLQYKLKPVANYDTYKQSFTAARVFCKSLCITPVIANQPAIRVYYSQNLPNSVTTLEENSRGSLLGVILNDASTGYTGGTNPGSARFNGSLVNSPVINDNSTFEITLTGANGGALDLTAAGAYTLQLEVEILDTNTDQ